MAEHKALTSGRTRRAIKIGGLASQVGSSYLWASLRQLFQGKDQGRQFLYDAHVKNARRIVESSKQLRGAFMKLIQMLSMRADMLPAEALDILKLTQSNVPPMDYAMISEQIRHELRAPPERLFASFEPVAFAAASLGQVHRARLKSGEEVAVKVQYPGVDKTVEQDLRNLKLLLQTFAALARDVMRQKIEVRKIYLELEERLREELDYVAEANNMAYFGRLLADDPEVAIPRVIENLSSRRVLTMTYLDGYPLADVLAPGVDPELKAWLAKKYFALVWRQILEFGALHTDPHPGNYLVSWEPKLGILDFGSIRRFSEPIRRAQLKLALAIVEGDEAALGQALVSLGHLEPKQDRAPMVKIVRVLFEPILVDRLYDPNEYDSVAKAREASEIAFAHKLYKSPPHSVFMLRALIGLDGIMKQLGVVANYRRIFSGCVRRAAQVRGVRSSAEG
jgi:predicted unusual protein kinase regulating ubiquinone biosynthesis (AarF/ABC1/UbiB family)